MEQYFHCSDTMIWYSVDTLINQYYITVTTIGNTDCQFNNPITSTLYSERIELPQIILETTI